MSTKTQISSLDLGSDQTQAAVLASTAVNETCMGLAVMGQTFFQVRGVFKE